MPPVVLPPVPGITRPAAETSNGVRHRSFLPMGLISQEAGWGQLRGRWGFGINPSFARVGDDTAKAAGKWYGIRPRSNPANVSNGRFTST
jgi:hypothetical protein